MGGPTAGLARLLEPFPVEWEKQRGAVPNPVAGKPDAFVRPRKRLLPNAIKLHRTLLLGELERLSTYATRSNCSNRAASRSRAGWCSRLLAAASSCLRSPWGSAQVAVRHAASATARKRGRGRRGRCRSGDCRRRHGGSSIGPFPLASTGWPSRPGQAALQAPPSAVRAPPLTFTCLDPDYSPDPAYSLSNMSKQYRIDPVR